MLDSFAHLCYLLIFTFRINISSNLKTLHRRGQFYTIYSENGTNLVTNNKELCAIIWKQIEDYATVKKINRKINNQSVPWWAVSGNV